MIKDEFSDEDLLTLIQAGSKSAEDALYERYYIYSINAGSNYAKLYFNTRITAEEFTAVAFSKVYDALKNYNRVRVSFNAYWHVLVRNAILDYINHNTFPDSVKMCGNRSLDDLAYYSSDELTLSDVIGEDDSAAINGDTLLKILNEIVTSNAYDFSQEERIVLELLYILGYKKREILKLLEIDDNHLSYVIKVLKKKITKILKDSYL